MISEQIKEVEKRTVPKGFRVTREPTGSIWIDYHSGSVRGPAIFFVIWVVFTSLACVGSVYDLYSGYDSLASFASYLAKVPWLGWLAVAVAAMFMIVLPAVVLAWFLFGQSRHGLSDEGLWVQKRLFFWQSNRFIPLQAMRSVRQVKDGGQEEDSFPTWGLRIQAEGDTNLLWRQPIEKSDWLGEVLSECYDIPFVPSDERE